jgi:hypothetical protein
MVSNDFCKKNSVLYGERDVEEDLYELTISAEKNRKDAVSDILGHIQVP